MEATQLPEARTALENPMYSRGTRMVKIEIDVLPDTWTAGSTGILFHRGKQVATVMEQDLPILQSLVRTEDELLDIKMAEQQHEKRLARHIATALANVAADDPTRAEIERGARAKYSGSVVAVLKELFGREMSPVLSLKVLETDLPNATDVETEQREARQAARLAEAIKAALGGQAATEASVIAKAVAMALQPSAADEPPKRK